MQSESSDSPHVNDRVTLSFIFTDKDAGIIIGKNGANIKPIKENTNCLLVFHGSIGSERILSVTGTTDKVPAAVSMVAASLIKKPTRTLDLDEKSDLQNSVILLLLLPSSICGPLIGRGGEIIKEIMRESKTKILIFFDNVRPAKERITKIQGTPENIEKAINSIVEVIQKSSSRGDFDSLKSDSATPKAPQHLSYILGGISHKTCQTLLIDKNVARIIVGKGGATVREIRQISNAHIIVKDIENKNESSLSVSGDPSSVAVAMHLIESRVISQAQGKDFDNRVNSINKQRSFNTIDESIKSGNRNPRSYSKTSETQDQFASRNDKSAAGSRESSAGKLQTNVTN